LVAAKHQSFPLRFFAGWGINDVGSTFRSIRNEEAIFKFPRYGCRVNGET
jgi:hypothetical protein